LGHPGEAKAHHPFKKQKNNKKITLIISIAIIGTPFDPAQSVN